MADQIIIQGVGRYDGEYELDLEEPAPSTLEWRWIKKISGYLPLTIEDGFRGGDPDLYCALAVIALYRGGKIRKDEALTVADTLADSPFDGTVIRFVADEEDEGDVGPPEVTPATDSPKKNSGESLKPSSDPPEPGQPPTGTQDSETASGVPV